MASSQSVPPPPMWKGGAPRTPLRLGALARFGLASPGGGGGRAEDAASARRLRRFRIGLRGWAAAVLTRRRDEQGNARNAALCDRGSRAAEGGRRAPPDAAARRNDLDRNPADPFPCVSASSDDDDLVGAGRQAMVAEAAVQADLVDPSPAAHELLAGDAAARARAAHGEDDGRRRAEAEGDDRAALAPDRKSTRLNSSHRT